MKQKNITPTKKNGNATTPTPKPTAAKNARNKLTDTKIRTAKATGKKYKMFDGGGLYVEVSPTGGKFWRIAFRFHKEDTIYLPPYPDMTLEEAREELRIAKSNLAKGIDPKIAYLERKNVFEKELLEIEQQKQAAEKLEKTTFRYVAESWLIEYAEQVKPKQIDKIKRHLEKYLYPAYGSVPVMDLKGITLLQPAKVKQDEGKIHTAHRLVTLAGQVLDHAILMGLIEVNIARAGLIKKLKPERVKHHAAITDPNEIGELLCDIEDYTGSAVMKYFLTIMPYVYTRNSELRRAEWSEFDLENEMLWVVPKERMKIKEEDHKVPLSHQVVARLKELKAVTGSGKYLFPSVRANTATLSDAGPLGALRRMGYDTDTMTIHGWRTIASTLLNERGYSKDHIEKQLAHKDPNEVRDAYNRAEYMEQRKELNQDWADILDELRQQARNRRAEKKSDRMQRLGKEPGQ